MFTHVAIGPHVIAQELIGPGASSPIAEELPAPTFDDEADQAGSMDRLEEYRRTLEEHLLKKEQAKLEARSRFESRSLDRIPAPLPPRRISEESNIDEPGRWSEADRQSSPEPSGAPENEDELPSPSDLKRNRDQRLDDLLAPPVPSKDSSPKATDDLPSPLPNRQPTPRPKPPSPQPLGGGAIGGNVPKFEVTPDEERQRLSLPKKKSSEEAESNVNKLVKPQEPSTDRSKPPADPTAQSVLQPLMPHEDESWKNLVDAERYRWGMPASFRGTAPLSDVMCSTCGGCVDRRGKCGVDRLGRIVGVGTTERPKCQCWRCPQQPPFNTYGVGGYVGPARTTPVAEYRLRGGDQIELTFLIKTVRTAGAYRLVVGDELLIESDADANLTRGTLDSGLEIQPDGTITLRFIGQVHAAGQTIEQLRAVLNDRYEEYYPDPAIDVTPVQTNNVARQIREAISGSEGFNPQTTVQTITPEGTIRLPRLGAIPTQGLTLGELKQEINLRYDSLGAGLEVEVVLEQQAPHFVYVLGEVTQPGRFEMTTPTTVLGGLSLAGSYVPGANLRQVVIFRRGANWELLSTILDLRGAILGKASRPADEIWLQDGDIIIVPPTPIRVFDRFVQQVFTEGIYGVAPFLGNGLLFPVEGNLN
ncbi:polysaccharide biosynthesis/export family protein [Neorhodopirellula pilleata]|nr:polysaccharide biosynthesis/export family protein [Neorhodopirellula pilleata]